MFFGTVYSLETFSLFLSVCYLKMHSSKTISLKYQGIRWSWVHAPLSVESLRVVDVEYVTALGRILKRRTLKSSFRISTRSSFSGLLSRSFYRSFPKGFSRSPKVLPGAFRIKNQMKSLQTNPLWQVKRLASNILLVEAVQKFFYKILQKILEDFLRSSVENFLQYFL